MTTYYVGPSGDNSNNGTSTGTAWASPNYAANFPGLQPGDDIAILAGTYREQINCKTKSGTASAPIRMWSHGGPGAAKISGKNSGGTVTYPTGTYVANTDVLFESFSGPFQALGFVWAGLLALTNVKHWLFDGIELLDSRGRGIGTSNCENVHFTNMRIDGSRNALFNANNTTNVSLTDSTLLNGANFAEVARSAAVSFNGTQQIGMNWPVIVNMVNSQSVRIQGNTVFNSWGEGIATGRGSVDIIISDNIVFDCMALLLYLHYSKNLTCERNILFHTTADTYNRGANPSGAMVVNQESQTIGGAFDPEPSDNFIIRNNLVFGRAKGYNPWNNQGGGSSSGYLEINNNTFVSPSSGFAFSSQTNGNIYTDKRFYNNIVYKEGGANPFDGTVITSATADFRNNLWGVAPNSAMQGPGDVTGNPGFVNPKWSYAFGTIPNPNDWRISPSSPAYRKGYTGLFSPTDYFGTVVVTTPDIGFHYVPTGGVVDNPPNVTQPPSQNGQVGTATSYQVVASDPDVGDTLTYSASNLPPGMSINSSTGDITGTPTSQGAFTVNVTVTDGDNPVTRSFLWTIVPAAAAKVLIASFTYVKTDNTVVFTNTTTATNTGAISYLWDFGDGNTSTATNPTHTYTVGVDDTQATVTLTAIEASTASNKVLNGDFSNGAASWSNFDPANNATLVSGQSGSGYQLVSSGANNTQIYQSGISLIGGQVYTLRFYNKGNISVGKVKIIRHASPFGVNGLDETIPYTSEWTLREFTFTVPTTITNCRLQFAYFGNNAGSTIAVDEVELLSAADASLRSESVRTVPLVSSVAPSFALDTASGAAPLTVTATDSTVLNAEVDVISHEVDWGDGTTTGIAIGGTAQKTYTTAGNYTAVLRVETNE